MNQEEWLKEFERLNGRPATEEEIASVWGAGDGASGLPIEDEERPLVFATEVSVEESPETVEGIQVSKPSHKLSVLEKCLGALAAVLVVAFAVFVFIRNQQARGINGTWVSAWTQQEIENTGLDSSALEDVQFRLVVKDGKASMVTRLNFDEKSVFYDQDEVTQTISQANGAEIVDLEKGIVDIPNFEGTVDAEKGQIDRGDDHYTPFKKKGEKELTIENNDGENVIFHRE
ncbi:hypothetical protein [Streptococcus sp. DD13]|uniref:hypothetical protein n=1 Tax=Streptococcus sp. DD13 TaxID=1777881 RepID=UPI000799266F|nr:hypothetical protein [Streptococcus sp. DD13]KXT77999.1 hypothetical protein STRDD13_01097 [Streptococcus sp. DD13]